MTHPSSPQASSFSVHAIQTWIVDRVARLLGVSSSEINIEDRLSDFGLESVEAFTLSGELSDLLGLKLSPTLAWDFPTIGDLALFLAELKHGAAVAPAVQVSPLG